MSALARQLHMPIVGVVPPSKEVQSEQESLSNALQSLESWLETARTASGLTHGQVCAHITNGKGNAYDQSQWTKARATGDLPLGRMLAGLPDVFWRTFAISLATAYGLKVSHADIADVAIERTAIAFEAAAEAFRHMRRPA